MFASDLPLSRTVTDRAADLRGDENLLAALLDDDTTRVLLVSGGRVVTRSRNGRRRGLALYSPQEAALRAPTGSLEERWAFLGYDDADQVPGVAPTETRPGGPAYVAHHVPEGATAALPAGDDWAPLREVGNDLSARDVGLATAAVALFEWHVRHPRCPRCGAATTPVSSGWVRRCPVDGSDHYPRTDPAVIMAVVDDDDRLLLANSAAWPQHRFSTLAGFVEPGESVEHAIRREVREESSVVVGEVEYRGSQPWPFPASLMLGFRARALSTDITVDGVELRAARWFDRDTLRSEVASGAVVLPPGTSIARALIEDWFGEPLPSDPLRDGWSRGAVPPEGTPSSDGSVTGRAAATPAAAEPAAAQPDQAGADEAGPDQAGAVASEQVPGRTRRQGRRAAPGPVDEGPPGTR
ncbi:NAD(+) diphosphatase [Cellulomonas hominis]|uniref:NAD(+) diphosphatase n=1 Tax=Cellulomonas hominis TaxID=156981 RepID=UPI001B9811F1|nr:NADH pyrophosphatase [Cellulomonas hominis]